MTHSFQFNIEERDAGQRLDEFFAARFGSLTRMRIAKLMEAGACYVNGAVGRAGYRLLSGDSIELAFDDSSPTAMSPEPIPVEIIYEDEQVIVVVKPAGMLVHPTMSVKSGTLINALAYHLNRSRIEGSRIEDGGSRVEDGGLRIEGREAGSDPPHSSILNPPSSILNPLPVIRPGLAHRLDKATSGLMVVAKTSRALRILSRHFLKRMVEKRYIALVAGEVRDETGTIDAPIGRDAEQPPRWRVMETGRPAETRFEVLERFGRATLLELEPVTGRTNQLRIHSAHIGHPIIGDEMHLIESGDWEGGGSIGSPESGSRLCLHASRLAFHHPAGSKWLEFTSPLPSDILETIESFRMR